MPSFRRAHLGIAIAAALTATPVMATDWLQFGYDQAHSGNNTAETTLTPANVGSLTRLFKVTLPGTVDSQPIFLANVAVTGGTKDLLFVVTTAGELMALDASSGVEVWHATPTATSGGGNITTSTPAVDPGRQFVYAYGLDGKVHKYQVGDGTEIKAPVDSNWPQLATTKTSEEKGAAGLSIATIAGGANYMYVANDGHNGDGGDYQGHVTTINLATGAQTVFNAQCSNLPIHLINDQSAGALGVTDCPKVTSPFPGSSGVWGRPGAVYDAGTNRVFFATGNGLFDARDTVMRSGFEAMQSGFNWGDSVLALAADGSSLGQMPVDSYTPNNYAGLQSSDADLGSVSPAILPAPAASTFKHLAVQGGKDAKLRLLNLANLSGKGAPGFVSPGTVATQSELQILNVPQGGQVRAQPAVWVDTHGDGATWVYIATSNGLSGLKISVNGSGVPSLVSGWAANISGNTTSAVIANDILYAENGTNVIAVDPKTGKGVGSTTTLWTSETTGSFHWQSLSVVNGRVYAPDNSGNLWGFALPQ